MLKIVELYFYQEHLIINYPNEIAIFYNILRGTIRSFTFKLNIKKNIPKNKFINLIRKRMNNTDYIEYKPSTENITITINPFNFIDRYNTKILINMRVLKE